MIALATAATPARGDGGDGGDGGDAPRIDAPVVLEVHVGDRPDHASARLAPLIEALEARGFVARPRAIIDRVGMRAPRPGALDRARTARGILQVVDAGYDAFTRGRYVEAERVMHEALSLVRRNPALLVLDAAHQDAVVKLFTGLALTQARLGDRAASRATMTELVRTLRGRALAPAEYGPEAAQLYRTAARATRALGRGELEVEVDSDQAVIFVDGQVRGVGRVALGALLPGSYRVFIQVPAGAGRQYTLEVAAHRRTRLRVDWELDSALWMDDHWLGFVFATAADRARLGGLLTRLARAWGAAGPFVVVSLGPDGAPSEVRATLHAETGRVIRGAVVRLVHAERTDGQRLRALARFLADGTPSEGVQVVAASAGGGAPNARAPPRRGQPSWTALRVPLAWAAARHAARHATRATERRGTQGVVALAARGGRRVAPVPAIGHSGAVLGWTGEL